MPKGRTIMQTFIFVLIPGLLDYKWIKWHMIWENLVDKSHLVSAWRKPYGTVFAIYYSVCLNAKTLLHTNLRVCLLFKVHAKEALLQWTDRQMTDADQNLILWSCNGHWNVWRKAERGAASEAWNFGWLPVACCVCVWPTAQSSLTNSSKTLLAIFQQNPVTHKCGRLRLLSEHSVLVTGWKEFFKLLFIYLYIFF